LLALAITCCAHAGETSLNGAAWLAGCWASDNADPGSGEQWMVPAGGAMLGMSRTIRAGKIVNYEFMRIDNAPDGKLAFHAQPSGKTPASFELSRLSATELVFENLGHEFPQRIMYRFEAPDRLFASIEGKRNGASKRIDYPMARVRCDAPIVADKAPN
jgi:hypothetical protein